MRRRIQGQYTISSTVGEKVKAFVPRPLPPKPGIRWSIKLRNAFDRALLALGRLDSVAASIPNIEPLLYSYVRKEAVLSSMIEGTQSSISDLMVFEIAEEPGVPMDDITEVSSYVVAMNHGLKRLESGFPLTLRLLKEIHKILLSGGRGSSKAPGKFRRTQNWIGGTRPENAVFVPPPPNEIAECMGKLELFLHDKPQPTTVLVKAALAHVQFETIHPFLDGNGRLGRLLITLLLCDQKVLSKPLLYLSLFFKTHRARYYELLNIVRRDGDWEAWLEFFAEAVETTATQAFENSQRISKLMEHDRLKIAALGRGKKSALEVHQCLAERPIVNSKWVVEKTGMTAMTVNKALVKLENLGVVKEITERKRSRLYSYAEYIDILNEGTEPIE
ncbi:MAG: Fic family protein [Planctomycetes bacterium]|nr:Fic family protein [Planctomycetota bacterium]